MHRDTIQDDDRLLTERFLVTLKRDPAKPPCGRSTRRS
jgi:hypothetical protein